MDFHQKLKNIQQQGNLRTLKTVDQLKGKYITMEGRTFINFTSNDYLGLGQLPLAHTEGFERCNLSSSRLVSGNDNLYQQTEEAIADALPFEACLITNSGYDANLAVFNIFKGENVIVLSDAANHASLIDGIKLSGLNKMIYSHLDYKALDHFIDELPNDMTKVIVTDSVFSTDGDKADLKELFQIKERHSNTLLLVDDSHGFGLGLDLDYSKVDILTASLSKGMGAYGGVILCPSIVRELVINTGRAVVYSSGLPGAVLVQLKQKYQALLDADKSRGKLKRLSDCFNDYFQPLWTESIFTDTPIKAIEFKTHEQAENIYQTLLDQGILVSYFRYPTVSLPTLRISLNTYIDEADIKQLFNIVKGVVTHV